MLLFAAEDLQLNSGTALGFDTDKSSDFKLEGCRFRRVGSAYASRCTLKVLPNTESAPWLERSLCYAESRHDQDHFSDLAVIAMRYQQRIPVQEILEAFTTSQAHIPKISVGGLTA